MRWPAALLGTLLLLSDSMFFGLARLHMLDMGTVLQLHQQSPTAARSPGYF